MSGNNRFKYRNARREDVPAALLLSTKDVQNYIQERIDVIVAALRNKNPKYADLKDIQIRVAGAQASDKFVPLMIILPPEALEAEATSNDEVPYIFLERDEDGQLTLIPAIEKLFKCWAYTKEDKKAFENPRYQRAININRKMAADIINFTTPRYRQRKDGDEKTEIIMFFIDPIKIFHEMLTEENETKSFKIDIANFKKIRNGEYDFKVMKYYGKKKKSKENPLIKDIDGFLRRGGNI